MVAYSWIMKPKCFYWGCSQINPRGAWEDTFPANTMIVISKPMTDPWCCYIWCAMDPINIPPLRLFTYIQTRTMDPSWEILWHGTHFRSPKCCDRRYIMIYRKPMVLRKLPYFHVLFSIQDIMSLYIYIFNILNCWKAPPFFCGSVHTHISLVSRGDEDEFSYNAASSVRPLFLFWKAGESHW